MRYRYDPLHAKEPSIDNDPYRKLWASVLLIAVRDMNHRGKWRDARFWLYSKHQKRVGSAGWICDMLDLDLDALQRMCLTRAGRKQILRQSDV